MRKSLELANLLLLCGMVAVFVSCFLFQSSHELGKAGATVHESIVSRAIASAEFR